MIRSNPIFPRLSARHLSYLFLPLWGVACASGNAELKIGTSMDAEVDKEGLSDDDDEGPSDGDKPADNQELSDADDLDDPDEVEGQEPDAAEWNRREHFHARRRAHREHLEAELARAALHAATPAENHLGLVMAVSERTSDLAWVLAIENRSPEPVQLAALPALLRATITPPPPAEPDGDATAQSAAVKTTKAQEPTVCENKSLPRALSEDDTVELLPKQLLFYAFDPRDLCDGEDALREGATVELSYGFPLQTKKLWKGGKLATVEVEQTAPFVAERKPSGGEEFVPLKFLSADPIRLDQTYPLSEVSALPSEENSDSGSEGTAAPPPPLELKVFPLGTSSQPEEGVVTVQLRNTSGKTMKIFIRRELFTYEISGPMGEATCQMYPSERYPDASAFSTLAPGESRSLSTRLAEACPEGTWDEPGTYSVSAYFLASADGAEHGIDAFIGSAVTTSAARLVVPGGDAHSERRMKLAPIRLGDD